MIKTGTKRGSAVTVDVGVNALGWAVWSLKEWEELCAPLSCGVINAPSKYRINKDQWPLRVAYLLQKFKEVCLDCFWPVRFVISEYPEQRSGSVGLAASGSGTVAQLAYCTGAHSAQAQSLGAEGIPVAVSTWKGTLKKDTVELRIKRAIGSQSKDGVPFKTHAWDAVGIGLWAKGFHFDNYEVYGC